MAFDIFMIVFLFIVGLYIGMFSVMLGLNLPTNKKNFWCLCDKCSDEVSSKEVFPLVSFFINRGKCKHCKQEISWLIPVVQILGAIFCPLSYIIYGFSYEMIAMLLILFLLLTIIISDFKHYIILDGVTLGIGLLFLLFKFIFFGYKVFGRSLLAAIVLFIFMYVVKLIGDKLFKMESLGGGDVKLLFTFGCALGIRLGMVSLILGSFLAFPYALYYSLSKTEKEIPFGPFLVAGLFIVFLFMDPIRNFLMIIFSNY